MRNFLTIIFLLLGLHTLAQNYPITGITISLPANPDANIANWGSGTSLFNFSAMTRPVNGKVDGRLQGSKVLVMIKKGGTKICGTYTSNTAPGANFNISTKVWSGTNAASLIGQNCTLMPGDYELSIQFFGEGAAGVVPFSEEKVKSFTIRGNEQQAFQSPQAISPANGTTFNETNFTKPLLFRWTPVVPRPAEPVIYKLRVWQLMLGQDMTQALRANQPIITKDVDNLTQAMINPVEINPCKPPYSCSFVWNVQAVNREGKPIGGNNGTSETFSFKREQIVKSEKVSLLTPANKSTLSNQKVRFSWMPLQEDNIGYRIKIVEIMGDQSPEDAMRTNKPFFEKDSCCFLRTNKPFFEKDSLEWLVAGNQYAWNVQALNREGKPIGGNNGTSEIFSFKVDGNNSVGSIKLVLPSNQSTIPFGQKTEFTWTPFVGGNVTYNIKIVEILGDQSPENALRVNKPFFEKDSIKEAQFNYPMAAPKFIEGRRYAWTIQVSQKRASKIVIGMAVVRPAEFKVAVRTKPEAAACKDDLIRNGEFVVGNHPGPIPNGSVQYWGNGYGSPIVSNDPNEGFMEDGYVKLTGNVLKGQAIVQALDPNHKITQSKKYKLSIAVRFKSVGSILNYVRISAVAFNGSIFSPTGTHPLPSTNLAIIGRSSKILDCGDWSVIELPVWVANKDFSNIAIHVFTNDLTNATVLIDGITCCETTESGCDEVLADAKGNPIIPAGFGNQPSGIACATEAEEDDYFNGSLQDLYPSYDGTTNFYASNWNDCSSIGGVLPPELATDDCVEAFKAAGIEMSCDELDAILKKDFIPNEKKEKNLPIIGALTNTCDKPLPKGMESMPFHGRDIIYIHGLQLSHLIDRSNGIHGATGQWPNNQAEYFSGYYKTQAYANMMPHISHFLGNRGNKNRFLVVAYDCSEDAETAIHAVLTQIKAAMENGMGVQADKSDPRGTSCFGRSYVFISHSTGALIADVALTIANRTKISGGLQDLYGNLGLISDRCKGRVNIQGAYSGSNLAKIACLGQNLPPLLLSTAISAMTFTPFNIQNLTSNPQLIANSILVDLVPNITRARWGAYINDVPVPVFSIAGAHPSAILGPLKYIIHPGFDDGVLTMDCVNGNNNPLSMGPSSFKAPPAKVFDMGIPLIRAIEYYRDGRIGNGVFAATSTPYLSPTGMVEPVTSIVVPSQNHFNNHFSFLQSTKEHWFNATELGSGNAPYDYSRTAPGGYTNNEEMLVVANATLFTSNLIDPTIISQMGETLRDKHISYPALKIVTRHGIPRPTIYWKKFYIWKRTYHKLSDSQKYDVDYGYKYLFTL